MSAGSFFGFLTVRLFPFSLFRGGGTSVFVWSRLFFEIPKIGVKMKNLESKKIRLKMIGLPLFRRYFTFETKKRPL